MPNIAMPLRMRPPLFVAIRPARFRRSLADQRFSALSTVFSSIDIVITLKKPAFLASSINGAISRGSL